MFNNLKNNCCDGIYNSIDVHFTSNCDNKCKHCVDMRFNGLGVNNPNPDAIIKSIVDNKIGFDDVLFLGGEPCLYLDELLYCINEIKRRTHLKVFTTTAIPKICYDKYDTFINLINILDGLNLSVQHNNEEIADIIRCTKSKYDRQSFYNNLPYKDKIRINLNIVKPYLHTKKQITECIEHYDKMKFNSIKLSEIQHGKEYYTSFEKVFNINLGSPYYNGCQSYLDLNSIFNNVNTPVLLKRSCFMCEETLNACIMDGIKVLSKLFIKPNNKYSVIYGNGEIKNGWV